MNDKPEVGKIEMEDAHDMLQVRMSAHEIFILKMQIEQILKRLETIERLLEIDAKTKRP